MKPLLSGPPIKRTPSIKRTLSRVPKLMSHISLYHYEPACIQRTPLLNRIWLISMLKTSKRTPAELTEVILDYFLEIRHLAVNKL